MFPTLRLCEAVSAPFKRAQLGLFQGKMKQYGNNVPFSKQKTRRSWLPNVHSQRLFSETLQDYLRVKVTARALKTIKKVRLCVFLSVKMMWTVFLARWCRQVRYEDETGAVGLGGYADTGHAARIASEAGC